MNVKTLPLLISTTILCFCSGKTENSNETLAAEDQSEWVLLSEGNTLDQWEMYNQGEMKGWELKDGELYGSGAGWDADEDIITKQAYENFELSLEWRIAPENSSGILLRAKGERSANIRIGS